MAEFLADKECDSALKYEAEEYPDGYIAEELSCDLCGKIFTNRDEFMIHKKSHREIFTCDICGMKFNRKDTLQRHSKTHGEKKIKCHICRKEFTNVDEKYIHVKEEHGIIPKKEYSPEFKIDAVKKIKEIGLIKAGKELHVSESTLSNWQRVIFNPLYCSFCGKVFPGEGKLKLHEERVHLAIVKNTLKANQEKEEHQCDKCSKLFKFSSDLKRHMYNCSGYKAKLNSSSTLYCEICQTTFSKRKGLAAHIRFVHEKEKNFCCEFCTKTFARKNTLTQHITDVHEQSGNFACGFCDKKYFKERDKTIHERKHTGVKPYQCENCGESCSTYKAKKAGYKCEKCNAALLPVLLQHVVESVESGDKDENYDRDENHDKDENHGKEESYEKDKDENHDKNENNYKEINKILEKNIHPTNTDLRELYIQKYTTDQEDISKDGEDTVKFEMQDETEEEMMKQNVKEETLNEEIIDDKHFVQNVNGTNVEEMMDTNCFIQNMKELKEEEINVKKANESDDEDMITESHFENYDKKKNSSLYCNICQKNFSRKKGLAEHIRFVHEKEKNFFCRICNKMFARKNSMTTHIKDVHEKSGSFLCGFCDKKFCKEGDKIVHERKHTGEQPYQCENCGDNFKRKTTLDDHMKSHSGVKEYQCFDCGKQYVAQRSLQRHVYTAHPNEFSCKTCDKKFNNKSDIQEHMKSHLGVDGKHFECFDCGKQFVANRSLKRHVYNFHLNEFPCSTCDNKINNKSHLKEHMKKYSLSLKQEKNQLSYEALREGTPRK